MSSPISTSFPMKNMKCTRCEELDVVYARTFQVAVGEYLHNYRNRDIYEKLCPGVGNKAEVCVGCARICLSVKIVLVKMLQDLEVI